jgi:extracellular factor (EF) 3-hydroxypalmitic acid methyl ester biosynthesis protein
MFVKGEVYIEIENALRQVKQLLHKMDLEAIKNNNSISDETTEIFRRSFSEFILFINLKIGDNADLDFFTKQTLGSWLQQEMLPYILLTKTAERFYSQPRGYAGDYKTIEMIYENLGQGIGRIGPIIDECFQATPAAQAVRNRRKLLAQEIKSLIETVNGKTVKICSLACGPAKEIFDVFKFLDNPGCALISLVDFDKKALASVEKKPLNHNSKINLIHENILYLALGKNKLSLQNQDLIYSIGLIDYFPDKIVGKLLNKIHGMLKPGGKVILGNFHPKNSCKAFMDHILNWKLIHRNEGEIRNIFEKSAFNCVPTKIYFEDQGINMFVECTKS